MKSVFQDSRRPIAGIAARCALVAAIAMGCGEPDPDADPSGDVVQKKSALCEAGPVSYQVLPFPWSGPVRYSFSPSKIEPDHAALTTSPDEQGPVRAAMTAWQVVTANQITFQVDDVNPQLIIEKTNAAATLATPGGGETYTLASGQWVVNFDGISQQTANHELGHVLDRYHEQQRFDRDRYLTMFPSNIGAQGGNCNSPGGPSYNETFTKIVAAQTYGTFDWLSVMLYDGDDGVGGLPSFKKKDGSSVDGWESRTAPSVMDGSTVLETMNLQYGWKPNTSLGFDSGASAPLVTALDHASTNPEVLAAPTIYYYRDAGGTKHMTAVVRGAGNTLWRREATSDTWTTNWTQFSCGAFKSDAAGVSWGNDRQDIVVLGLDNQIYKDGFHGFWEQCFSSLGAPPITDISTLSAPTIASKGSNKLSVYVVADGNLWSKSWVGTWSAWIFRGQPSGTTLLGGPGIRPAAVSTAANVVRVVARATDGTLWLFKDPELSWSRADNFTTSGIGSPAVASWGGGRLDIFVHGGAPMLNALFQRTIYGNGTETNWYALGGVFTSSPAAAADPDAQGLDVLGLSADQAADPSRADGVWWKRWRP